MRFEHKTALVIGAVIAAASGAGAAAALRPSEQGAFVVLAEPGKAETNVESIPISREK